MRITLPSENDGQGMLEFAQSFNGYEHYGSFIACVEAAQTRKRSSMKAIRNELFVSCRVSNHQGNDGFMATYKELLPLFRQFMTRD